MRQMPTFLLTSLSILLAGSLHAQQLAFTFDDLPAHGPLPHGVSREQVIRNIIYAMKEADAPPVYGFVNGVRLQENPADGAVLELWRAASFPLGNHTWSHMNLAEHSAADFEADIERNDSLLSNGTAHNDWHWFRFPFLSEGDTPQKRDEVRGWLAQHGYHIAGVTMSFGDFAFNEPYARCRDKGDDSAVTRLEDAYLQAARQDAAYRRQLAKIAFGHDIPYVLLMHVGAMDARMLPRLLAQYKAMGFHLISLQEAESAPFYANDLDAALPSSPDTLEVAAANAGRPAPHPAPLPEWLNTICR